MKMNFENEVEDNDKGENLVAIMVWGVPRAH